MARLRKALYGLKQSAKCWNDEITEKFTKMKMTRNPLDHCIWYRNDEAGEILVYLHVDDMAVTGTNIQRFKDEVKLLWNIDDLGPAKRLVGIELVRLETGGYKIHQEASIVSVVEKFKMEDSKPFSTPVPGGIKVLKSSKSEKEEMLRRNLPYRSVVGSLMYIAIGTRPDISFAVGVLSQHLESPSLAHWNLAMHVLRYLNGTKSLGIHYEKGDSQFNGTQSWVFPELFVDSDWGGDPNSRRSTTGYLFKLNGGAISWRSKLQSTVSLSSTEAEYRATTEAAQEAIWLRGILNFINVNHPTPTILCCDSQGAIDLSKKPVQHGRTKHIEVQCHWIREQVEKGIITLRHIPTEHMTADLLTKPLHPKKLIHFRSSSGLKA